MGLESGLVGIVPQSPPSSDANNGSTNASFRGSTIPRLEKKAQKPSPRILHCAFFETGRVTPCLSPPSSTMEYHTLRSRASQDTLVSNASTSLSLLELDPTPMDSPASVPYTDKDLPPLPEQPEESLSDSTHSLRSNPTTTSSVGLSGAGHGPIFYCKLLRR